MEYITTKEAADKWHITERRVRYLVKSGRIKDAFLKNHTWHIPRDSKKPSIEEYNKSHKLPRYPKASFSNGQFGQYGGSHMPDSFKKFFDEIIPIAKELILTNEYQNTLETFFYEETPILKADKFIKKYGNVNLYIKREDLTSSGSIYLYQCVMMALIAKKMKKIQVLTEANDASYAQTLAFVCKKLGVNCTVFIPYNDYLRQKTAFDLFKLYGSEYLYILEGNGSIEDATNSAFRKFLFEDATSLYVLHDAIGPHPIPSIVEFTQGIVGRSALQQLKAMGVKHINSIIAPSSVASNALGIFKGFPKYESSKFIVESSDINSLFKKENIGNPYGFLSKKVENPAVFGPMSYNCLSPQIAYLEETKQVRLGKVTDLEAMRACVQFYKDEGIFPSLADGYSLAYAIKRAQRMRTGNILIALTSSGEKDKNYIYEQLDLFNK